MSVGRWVLFIVGVCVAAGCGDSTSPNGITKIARDTSALFQTDSLGYTLLHHNSAYSMRVEATLTNRTTGSIYISNCAGATGIYLQKRMLSGWEIVRSPILPACLSAPIVVAVGATYTFNLDLIGGEPGSNLLPRYSTTELDGEYRLLWDGAFTTYDNGTGVGAPLAESSRVSNPFLVRVENRWPF